MNDIHFEGIDVFQLEGRMIKRTNKIAESIFWNENKPDEIDGNLYEYILDKVSNDYGNDYEGEEKVDKWIKNFWIMC